MKRFRCIIGASLAFLGSVAVSSVAQAQATGNLDCNGFSTLQRPVVPYMRFYCQDIAPAPGDSSAEDNGNYIGHDEPGVNFISNVPGSGNNVRWQFRLPVERPLPATQSFQNFIAFWFSMALCDPNSFPFGACVPDSDSNDPKKAGSALLELQFYPPGAGLAPNITNSCSMTDWCAALNIELHEQ
jgi:hypothetical protein